MTNNSAKTFFLKTCFNLVF